MSSEARTLELVDLVYRAALNRPGWADVAKALSDLCGGAAVVVSMKTSGANLDSHLFLVGMDELYTAGYLKSQPTWIPFMAEASRDLSERFVRMSDYMPADFVPGSELESGFLAPKGLALEPPIVHVPSPEVTLLSSVIQFWRLKDGPSITDEQLGVADRLVPHIARAIQIEAHVGHSEQAQVALNEVIDRIPTGVVILDTRRQPVVINRMGHRILDAKDGFLIDADGPRGHDRDSTRALRDLIDSAIYPAPGRELAGGGFMALTRPSGLRSYPLLVTPILGKAPSSSIADAAVLMFISDPELREISITNVLSDVYGLTPAEADLAQLLAQGRSLEEAARARGVTLNTARSQLKQVFAKTDTNRQGELLQLVLSGVATISTPNSRAEREAAEKDFG